MKYDILKAKLESREIITSLQIKEFLIKELTEGKRIVLDEEYVRVWFDSGEVLFQGVWFVEQEVGLTEAVNEILKNAPDEGVENAIFTLMCAADTSVAMEVFEDVLRIISKKLNDINITLCSGNSDDLDKGCFKVSMAGFGSGDT